MRNTAIILTLLASLLIGCTSTNPADRFRRRYHAPPLNEQVMMILDTDADRRREGINHLAASKVAQEEDTLLLFAEVAQNDSAAFVRSAAINALADGEAPSFAYVLIDALADPSAIVRADAAKGLGQLVVIEATQPLIALAGDRDEEQPVRVEAIRSLRNYHDLDAAHALVALMDQRQLIIRHEAHDSLVEMYQVDLGDSPRDWPASELANIPASAEPMASWQEQLAEKQAARRQETMDEDHAETEQWHEDYRQRYPTFPQEDSIPNDPADDLAEPIAADEADTTDDEPSAGGELDLDYNPDTVDDEWDFEMDTDAAETPDPSEPIELNLPDANDLPTDNDVNAETPATDSDEEWTFEIAEDPAEATDTDDVEPNPTDADDDAPPAQGDTNIPDVPDAPEPIEIDEADTNTTDTPPTQPPVNTDNDTPGLDAEDIFD